MDYLKTVSTAQFLLELGSNLVVINPGSANIRVGLAKQDPPFIIPHCIARRTNQHSKLIVQDQLLNSQVTASQDMERQKAYSEIATLLNIPSLDKEMGRADRQNVQNNPKDEGFTLTDTHMKTLTSSVAPEGSMGKSVVSESLVQHESTDSKEPNLTEQKFREVIYGEEALRISPAEPYSIRRPIRRGHLNISQHYPEQQVLGDLRAIWDWILLEKLHIPQIERSIYSAVLIVPETFDNREIKEILSIVLQELHFGSAVVYQEGLAAVFGDEITTACVVDIGAQVTSIICIEDGMALPNTEKTLPFGGEDISRCLLWTQRHHQTWPIIHTDILTKPTDLLILNKIKESYCEIKEGELDAVAIVHSYEDGMPPESMETRLTALNVPPMGLFYPTLLIPDLYPPPTRSWFRDYEDMLEDTSHIDLSRTDVGLPKKEEKVGLAEAITSSILSTERIDLQRKLFRSLQLIGGVALTGGLIPAVMERVFHTIRSNEAIRTVEALQSRTSPSFVSWKGGAILGALDDETDAWIRRDEWISNGIHIGSGMAYRDSFFLQAKANRYRGADF